MVPEAAFAISNPPFISLSFDPQPIKPLNILAGGSATFNMATFVDRDWADGNISLSVARAPSWANVTITPNLFTGITKKGYYNSTMTLKIAQDAPEGLTSIVVNANAIQIMITDGSRSIDDRLEGRGDITLNITAPPARITTTKTTTITSTLRSEVTRTSISTTTLTNTTTELVSDPSTYVWAVSATVAAAILAAVLLLQRRRSK